MVFPARKLLLILFYASSFILLSYFGYRHFANDPLKEGNRYREERHFAKALQSYRSAISSGGNNAALHFGLGQTYLDMGLNSPAADHFEKGLQLDPSSQEAKVGLAIASFRGKRYDKLEDIYRKFADMPAVEPKVRELLAFARLRQGNLSEAKTTFDNLISQNQGNPTAHLGAWTVDMLLGEDSDDYHLQIAIESSDEAVSSLAKDLKDSLNTARKLPEDGYLSALFGILYLKHNEPEIARNYLEQSLEQNSNRSDVQSYLGLAFLSSGETETAVKILKKAVETNPGNPLALHTLGLALRSQKQLEEARDVLIRAIEITQNDNAIRSDLGLTLALLGDYAGAEKQYLNATERTPTDIQAQLSLSRFYIDRGYQIDKGLLAAEKALSLDQNSGDALAIYGWALYLNGKLPEGENHLRKALAISEDSPQIHFYLGVLLENKGEIAEATRAFQTAFDLSSESAFGRRAQRSLDDLLAHN